MMKTRVVIGSMVMLGLAACAVDPKSVGMETDTDTDSAGDDDDDDDDVGDDGITEPTDFLGISYDDAMISTLEVRTGTGVTELECNDAIEPPGPQIEQVWTPMAGTTDITITPIPGPMSARADVTLNDFVFDNGGGSTVPLDEYVFTDITVGWLPG